MINEKDKKTQEFMSKVVDGNSTISGQAEEAKTKSVDVYDDIFEKAGE